MALWFKKAARQDMAVAEHNLGMMYATREKLSEADMSEAENRAQAWRVSLQNSQPRA